MRAGDLVGKDGVENLALLDLLIFTHVPMFHTYASAIYPRKLQVRR